MSHSLTVVIGMDDDDAPSGYVRRADAPPVQFAGWLELMHAISRLASASKSKAGPGPERHARKEGREDAEES